MEILTKFTPSFRLILFLFALPVFGFAQQFPINNQKIVQGVGTTAQGISSYSSSPPTTAPTAATFRHVTSLHMDTVLQVQYIYKRPRWYPISVVRRATPPPATASSGSTTIDYTESLWQSTADSLTYYYEEENGCWQPVGTYISSTTPSDVAATGSTGAICYGYGLWYDPDVDSIYAQQGATWTAIGAGGPTYEDWTAAADSGTPAVISDGETVTFAGGTGITSTISGNTVTNDLDNTAITPGVYGSSTQVSQVTFDQQGRGILAANVAILLPISAITGLADSAAAWVNGSLTNFRIPRATGANTIGNSTLLQSSTGVMLDANLAFGGVGGTTASRPTGSFGMIYPNTSNNWFDFHNGTNWFNPLRSATATGLGTSTHVGWFNASGLLEGSSAFTRNLSNGGIIIDASGSAAGTAGLEVRNTAGNISYLNITDASTSTGTGNGLLFGYNSGALIFNRENTPMFLATNGITRLTLAEGTAAAGFVSIGKGITSGNRLLEVQQSTALTNTINYTTRFGHITSGTAAAGFGVGAEFYAESAGGTERATGTFQFPWTTATNAAEVSDFVVSVMRAGTLTESLRSLGNGTLQIGTLSGTATQLMGATSTNIATAVTLGAGLSFSSGTLNGAFLPLTLTGTTEVNTAGQSLRFRDAGGYPDVFMNTNYFLAASSVNNYIDVGSTANRIGIISDGLIELNSSVNTSIITTGRLLIDGDSTVLSGTLPVNTNATHVLVRDAVTERVEEFPIGEVGTWLKPELEAGNSVSITGTETNNLVISGLTDATMEATAGTSIATLYIESGDNAYGFINAEKTGKLGSLEFGSGQNFGGNIVLGDTCTVILSAAKVGNSAVIGMSPNGNTYIRSNFLSIQDSVAILGELSIVDITNGNATALPGYTSGNVLTTTTLGASLSLSSGTLSTAQSFFNDYDASITLTGITSTPDTIDADSNVKSNDFAFNTTTNTYTYNGVSGRYYSVSVSAQMEDVSGNAETLTIGVYRNGTVTSAVARTHSAGAVPDPIAMHGQAILLMTNGDTINAKVSSTSGAGDDFNLLNYSLIIKEI